MVITVMSELKDSATSREQVLRMRIEDLERRLEEINAMSAEIYSYYFEGSMEQPYSIDDLQTTNPDFLGRPTDIIKAIELARTELELLEQIGLSEKDCV